MNPAPNPAPTPLVGGLQLRLDPTHYVNDIATIRQAVVHNGAQVALGQVTVTSPYGQQMTVYLGLAFRVPTATVAGITGSLYTWGFSGQNGAVYTMQAVTVEGHPYVIAGAHPFPSSGGMSPDYTKLGYNVTPIVLSAQLLGNAVKAFTQYTGDPKTTDPMKQHIAMLSVALSEAVRLNAVRDAVESVLARPNTSTADLTAAIKSWGSRGVGV